MESMANSLINAGGLGVLAGALLWLHSTSLKAFRDELAAERQAAKEAYVSIVGAIQAQTAELRTAILASCRHPLEARR